MSDQTASNDDTRTGVIAAIAAYTLWGVLPIFYIWTRGISSWEVVAARIIFSVPFGALILTARHQWPEVRTALQTPAVRTRLLFAGAILAVNWLIFIFSVQSGRIFEASLGYYINPLIYVLTGVFLLGESLSRLKIVALVLATIGVAVLTIYGGTFPLIAFVLAGSFTVYGVVKKRVNVGAMPGLFIETLLIAPIALLGLLGLVVTTETAIASGAAWPILLLVLAGPVTVIPLLFFAIAARRLPLAMIGFLQFIGPTLSFCVGLIDGEPFTPAHQVCFAFVWTAVLVFIFDSLRARPKLVPTTPPAAKLENPELREK